MDDTALIQAMFDHLADPVTHRGGTLVLPNRRIVLSSTITSRDVIGAHVVGGGARTQIEWAGPAGADMFRFSNWRNCQVSNLFILCSAANPVGAVFQRVNEPDSNVDPGHCTYSSIEIEGTNGGFLCGFEISGKDANADFDHFIDVVLSNYTVAGWLNANTQSQSHIYDNCIARGYGGKFGIAGNREGTVGTRANFRWRGGFMAGHRECDFYISGAQNDSLIDGFDSEGSAQFLRTDGPSGAPLGLVIRQARWASNGMRPDGVFVDVRYPGPVVFEDCNQFGSDSGLPMAVNWNYIPGGNGLACFEIRRCRFTAAKVTFPGHVPAQFPVAA